MIRTRIVGVAFALLAVVAAATAWRYWPVDVYNRWDDSVPVVRPPDEALAVALDAIDGYGGLPKGAVLGPPSGLEQVTIADGPHAVSRARTLEYLFQWSAQGQIAPRDFALVDIVDVPVAACDRPMPTSNESVIRRTCDAYSMTFEQHAKFITRKWLPWFWRAFEQWRARAGYRAIPAPLRTQDSCTNHSLDTAAFLRVIGATTRYEPYNGTGGNAQDDYIAVHLGAAYADFKPYRLHLHPNEPSYYEFVAAIVGDSQESGRERSLFLKGVLHDGLPLKRVHFIHFVSADDESICRERTPRSGTTMLPEIQTLEQMRADALARANEEIEYRLFFDSRHAAPSVFHLGDSRSGRGTRVEVRVKVGRTTWNDRFDYSQAGWLQRAQFASSTP